MMLELRDRRLAVLAHLSPEGRERADFLRDALLTHLELVKRRVVIEKVRLLVSGVGLWLTLQCLWTCTSPMAEHGLGHGKGPLCARRCQKCLG